LEQIYVLQITVEGNNQLQTMEKRIHLTNEVVEEMWIKGFRRDIGTLNKRESQVLTPKDKKLKTFMVSADEEGW